MRRWPGADRIRRRVSTCDPPRPLARSPCLGDLAGYPCPGSNVGSDRRPAGNRQREVLCGKRLGSSISGRRRHVRNRHTDIWRNLSLRRLERLAARPVHIRCWASRFFPAASETSRSTRSMEKACSSAPTAVGLGQTRRLCPAAAGRASIAVTSEGTLLVGILRGHGPERQFPDLGDDDRNGGLRRASLCVSTPLARRGSTRPPRVSIELRARAASSSSDDAGRSWTQLDPAGFPLPATAIAVDPLSPADPVRRRSLPALPKRRWRQLVDGSRHPGPAGERRQQRGDSSRQSGRPVREHVFRRRGLPQPGPRRHVGARQLELHARLQLQRHGPRVCTSARWIPDRGSRRRPIRRASTSRTCRSPTAFASRARRRCASAVSASRSNGRRRRRDRARRRRRCPSPPTRDTSGSSGRTTWS